MSILLAWSVLTGLHRTVRMSFMLVGHTKFAPDWCFGLFKQRYRRTFVSSLDDVVDVVNTSADVNVAQLVGTGDWRPTATVQHCERFSTAVAVLLQCHYTRMSGRENEVLVLLEVWDAPKVYTKVTGPVVHRHHRLPTLCELPPLIKSSGLPLQRQWYLHKQIRPYCREGTEDLTCPKPSLSLDTTTNTTTNKTGGAPAPPAKRRKCGKCGEIGHTRRSCKED